MSEGITLREGLPPSDRLRMETTLSVLLEAVSRYRAKRARLEAEVSRERSSEQEVAA